MKKIIPLFIFIFTATLNFGQCDDLFISEYVEGYGNNRALEIYNPTNAAIDLSEYSVGRFSNGGISYVGIELPAEMLQPYNTYVVALDKRDSVGSGFETPLWNGYQLYDYCTDILTGDTLIGNISGDTIFCVQYDADGLHLYGNEYRDFLDLEGKADAYLCPVYNVNNAMYFNGNDAVVLVKGLNIDGTGSNVVDVIGVIGDPAMADNDAWVDASGSWLTRDKTLQRKPEVKSGTGVVIQTQQDTFEYAQYEVYWKNYFQGLEKVNGKGHECECDPDFVSSTVDLNQVKFEMYPNPATSELFLVAEESIDRVEIYNLLGERVMTQNFTYNKGEPIQMSIGRLETGMYMVSLFFENDHQSVKKLLKQ